MMHSGQRIWALTYRYWVAWTNDYWRVVNTYYWPLLEFTMWLLIGNWVGSTTGNQAYLRSFFIASAALWSLYIRVQYDVTINFAEEFHAQNLAHLFTMPLRNWEILASLSLIATVIFSSFLLLFILFFKLLGLASLVWSINFAGTVLGLYLTGLAFGSLVTSLLIRFGLTIESIIYVLPWGISLLAGVYNSIQVLPNWLQVISHLLPHYYFLEFSHQYIITGVNNWTSFSIGLLIVAGYLVAGIYLFNYMVTKSKQTGFSALYK
ncbi:MAG TPA: ABC transporter permease [Candidatus Babeliales bacterium]|nr:ABC transporter permease [Candidatus Babeliales bacterium]